MKDLVVLEIRVTFLQTFDNIGQLFILGAEQYCGVEQQICNFADKFLIIIGNSCQCSFNRLLSDFFSYARYAVMEQFGGIAFFRGGILA